MQKTRDTFIVSLNEAFWIPGSSKTCVLINCIFIRRNKTRIKQASIHTNHFSLTLTAQHCHHFRHWAGWQNAENYRLGTESHFVNIIFTAEISGDAQAAKQTDVSGTTPGWIAAAVRCADDDSSVPKGSRLITLLDYQTRAIRESYSFIPVMDLIKSAPGNKIKCM